MGSSGDRPELLRLEYWIRAGAPTPEFAPREFLASKDARRLARDLLGMPEEELGRAVAGSPTKRAKPRGPKRNASVVLGNFGTADDVDVPTRALDDPETLVREHAAWALARLGV